LANDRVRYEKKDHVAYVTLDRPEVLNAMDLRMHKELAEIWDDVEADDRVRVAVLTGAAHRAFSGHTSDNLRQPGATWLAEAHRPVHPVQTGGRPGPRLRLGRRMDAATALRFGLVNEVVAADRLDAAVEDWTDDLVRSAPLSVRALKEAALKSVDLPLAKAFTVEYV
jgi:enoyl-CoA hydratase/carnithine racemase